MIIYPVLAAGDESDRSIAIDQISTVFANEKEGLIEQEIVYFRGFGSLCDKGLA